MCFGVLNAVIGIKIVTTRLQPYFAILLALGIVVAFLGAVHYSALPPQVQRPPPSDGDELRQGEKATVPNDPLPLTLRGS